MDGFWTGSGTRQIYVNDGYRDDQIGEAAFSNPDKTNIEALRDGVKLVRQAAGPKVFFLGCCVSQNMRSSAALSACWMPCAWDRTPGRGRSARRTPRGCGSSTAASGGTIRTASPCGLRYRWTRPGSTPRSPAIAGDLLYNSDWMPDFPPDRLDMLRRCIPAHGLHAASGGCLRARTGPHLAPCRHPRPQRRDVVALYNWGSAPATIACPVERIGLPAAKEYVAFDFWSGRFLPNFKDVLKADLPGGSCKILAVRPLCEHPQLLSTSGTSPRA